MNAPVSKDLPMQDGAVLEAARYDTGYRSRAEKRADRPAHKAKRPPRGSPIKRNPGRRGSP